ncbi:hypothetical protein E8E11_000735 [Didymella keratinophila]|nr:hypothetical protein E8E11_000735 [Didymella keratinophila]
MADSDYSYDGDEISGDEYVGSRASSSRPAQLAGVGGGKQASKETAAKPARKAWETEYSRTVEKTIVPVNDEDLGQSVQEREEERKRKRLRKDTKPFQRGIIRHVVLVLDLSEAMLEKDMRPNRFYTMINYAQDYVREFFEQNPISQMSVLGMHDGICIRVSELSGNPAEHAAAILGLRSKETGKEPKGAPSLQNALELARATLYHTPNHGTREVIIVFGSLLSLDPTDIHQTIKACVRDRIRVSVIGMGARLKICQEIVTRTNAGDESEYTIATDQEMLKELLIATTTPPVIRSDTASTPQRPEKGAALMMMGFPSRVVEDTPTICACHGNLTLGGYTCSRCSAKVCSLPVTCPSCQLTLLLSTHLARSYHHLFPLRNWATVSWQRAREKDSKDCVGCLTTFPAVPSKQELAARALKKERQSTTGSMLNGHADREVVEDDENGEQHASESARVIPHTEGPPLRTHQKLDTALPARSNGNARKATNMNVAKKKIERPEDIVWTTHGQILHTSIRQLKRASDGRCRICRLVFTSPTQYEHATLLKDKDEHMHIVLTISTSPGTLPLLQVEFREASTSQARIPKRTLASCIGFLGGGKTIATWPTLPAVASHSAHDLAETLTQAAMLNNEDTGSDGAFKLASYWVTSCLNSHPRCHRTISAGSAPFLPTRLLDVADDTIRLIESKSVLDVNNRRYLALSHCWGLIPIIRTLKANYDKHKNHISEDELSKTFKEAIHATRKLGFQYIWIDSMCIIQDDSDDWAKEAATMCDVYQYATLTLAAAHAPGGDIGCFKKRDGLLNLPFHIDIPGQTTTRPTRRLQFTTYGRPQEKDLGGGDPALYGRAWVLQEQLLSPRMLIFDGDQLKWECLTMHGSEGSPTSGTTRHDLSLKYIRSGIMDEFEYFDDVGAKEGTMTDSQFWARMKHQYWCNLVMNYTHRGMTKSSDRLVALAGIAQALGRHTRDEYLAGLWRDHFFIGLLWSLPHNETFLMSATTNFDIERNERMRHAEAFTPSWSWASVTAPVMYGQNEMLNLDCMCIVENVKVSSGIHKQTGRATILGHVRKGYVNAIYQYSNREAVSKLPHMTAPPPAGRLGLEHMIFKDRSFHPIQYFLFAEQHPDPSKTMTEDEVRTYGSFRFVRGTFRPDEIIDPTQRITFVAIAQRHKEEQVVKLGNTYLDHDPVSVHTLALIPTGDVEGTYRRVGLAIWDSCSWYGYLCGWKHDRARRITAPREWDRGFHIGEYIWEEAYRRLWWDDMEFYKSNARFGGDGEDGRWKHDHEYESDQLPDLKMYKAGVKVEEKTVVVV